MNSTEREKNKLKRTLITEATTKKKAKVNRKHSLSRAWARRGLKAYITRSRCKLQQNTRKKCRNRSDHKYPAETQPTADNSDSEADNSNSEPAAFVESISSNLTAVEKPDLNVAKDDNSSDPAAFTEDTTSTLIVEEQELGMNVTQDECITKPSNSDECVNNAATTVEDRILTVAEDIEPVMLDERASNTPPASVKEVVSVMAEVTEPLLADEFASSVPASVEEVGLNVSEGNCSAEPVVSSVCVSNASADVEEVLSVAAESNEPVLAVECTTDNVASVEEVGFNLSSGDCSSERLVTSLSVNNTLAAAKELVSFVNKLVSILAEDTEPVTSVECASSTSASVEEVSLNMDKGESSEESPTCVNNVPAAVEEVVPIMAESTEPVLADECMSNTPASVEEAGSNVSKDNWSSQPVAPAACMNSIPPDFEEMVSTVVEDIEPVMSVECESKLNTPAYAEEVILNMSEGDCISGPIVTAVNINNENVAAAVEDVDSFRTEDSALSESSARCISNSAMPVEEADSCLTAVVTRSSKPVAVVMDTEWDTETRDVLPVPTTTVASSPAVMMVCSANCFSCII